MRKVAEAILIAAVVLFMAVGVIIVAVQMLGVVTLNGSLIQGVVDVLALYAYIPAAVVGILAYLLSYGAPSGETHDEARDEA